MVYTKKIANKRETANSRPTQTDPTSNTKTEKPRTQYQTRSTTKTHPHTHHPPASKTENHPTTPKRIEAASENTEGAYCGFGIWVMKGAAAPPTEQTGGGGVAAKGRPGAGAAPDMVLRAVPRAVGPSVRPVDCGVEPQF